MVEQSEVTLNPPNRRYTLEEFKEALVKARKELFPEKDDIPEWDLERTIQTIRGRAVKESGGEWKHGRRERGYDASHIAGILDAFKLSIGGEQKRRYEAKRGGWRLLIKSLTAQRNYCSVNL